MARIPLKFGPEVLTSVTCARAALTVENQRGEISQGWGETPLSVQWVWPGNLSYEIRENALKKICKIIARYISGFNEKGHPFELGHRFQNEVLLKLLDDFNHDEKLQEPLPYLAALVCFSLFDIALHDAYGNVNKVPTYGTYNKDYMNRDLSFYLKAADNYAFDFKDRYPEDFFTKPAAKEMAAWRKKQGKKCHIRFAGIAETGGYGCLDWGKYAQNWAW